MNAATLARSAYSNTTSISRNGRETEYDAFVRVTASLANANSAKGPDAFAQLNEAVFLNRRLWSILATDVADEKNGLPPETRAAILSLANFTSQHSKKVLRREAGVDALIEINSTIMRGLRSKAGG